MVYYKNNNNNVVMAYDCVLKKQNEELVKITEAEARELINQLEVNQ